MVLSRWAMVMVVRLSFAMSESSAACTTFSDAASRAEVASSSSRMAGLRMIVRAMATRCFCPPESLPPRMPTCVLYPSGSFSVMKACALAILAASSMSAWLARSGLP
mmetsp:Transcript_10867/g.23689  ORF Transcript_10867/g.23689 Transcript_10867/m.23689 type:complete len:107 (-) Transcript_10867:1521-1841(-)